MRLKLIRFWWAEPHQIRQGWGQASPNQRALSSPVVGPCQCCKASGFNLWASTSLLRALRFDLWFGEGPSSLIQWGSSSSDLVRRSLNWDEEGSTRSNLATSSLVGLRQACLSLIANHRHGRRLAEEEEQKKERKTNKKIKERKEKNVKIKNNSNFPVIFPS